MHTTILPIVAHKLKGTASYKCVWKLFLPFSLSKGIGRTPYIIDLPYPVGRDTKVSLQDTNASMASFCFSFNACSPISQMVSSKACVMSV